MSSQKDSFRIFFCRSETDLNVFLPLVKLAENNSILIFYESKFLPKYFTQKLLESLSISPALLIPSSKTPYS